MAMERSGIIALSMPGISAEQKADGEEKLAADRLHKEKIIMSDFIYVIDEDDAQVPYVGESTLSEIGLAVQLKITVVYHSTWKGDIKSIIKLILGGLQ